MSIDQAPDPEAVRRELVQLASTHQFARCTSLYAMLEYIVEETLSGRGATLKELVIGDALYGGRVAYDPRIDSTVRVEARRLRRKLADHYAGPAERSAVRIEIPVGCYRPVFTMTGIAENIGSPSVGACASQLDMAILPFRSLSSNIDDDSFADGLTDEVIYACRKIAGVRIAPQLTVFQYKNRSYSTIDAARELRVGTLLCGTVRSGEGRSRVTVEMLDKDGFVFWSDRVDGIAADSFGEQEEIARTIALRIPSALGRHELALG